MKEISIFFTLNRFVVSSLKQENSTVDLLRQFIDFYIAIVLDPVSRACAGVGVESVPSIYRCRASNGNLAPLEECSYLFFSVSRVYGSLGVERSKLGALGVEGRLVLRRLSASLGFRLLLLVRWSWHV